MRADDVREGQAMRARILKSNLSFFERSVCKFGQNVHSRAYEVRVTVFSVSSHLFGLLLFCVERICGGK